MSEYVITHFQSKKQEIPDAYEFVTNDGEEIEYRQIVRCRDCKHYFEAEEYSPHGNYDTYGCNYFASYGNDIEPDGFCAWGVRGKS